MSEIYSNFTEILKKPAVIETLIDLLLVTVPIWLAVMIGLVIGWSWRPRWTGLVFLGLRSRFRFLWTVPPGLGARRVWFAFTALSAFSVCGKILSNFRRKDPVLNVDDVDGGMRRRSSSFGDICSAFSCNNENPESAKDIVTESDLEHFLHLLDGKVGEVAWQNQMDRTTSNMSYQAWRLDPPVGAVIYRSRTVFEDATAEMVRDFFWDDEFRCKWDNMLTYYKILEEFPQNGTMIVHWIKKFPFFCSDREYIIGRRIWESGKTYYCVTKGVPYPSIPKNDKPRRVELYFSSWRIRAVESRKQDGQMTACEVSFIHYEDMGIPKDVAKMGVRHGMWGTVKKLHSGLRSYQLARRTADGPLSRCAMMAHITTKVSISGMGPADSSEEGLDEETNGEGIVGHPRGLDWKWVAIGGVAVVCGLHTGLIGKALLFGAARRLGRR